jgi:acyl-CoA reductase-like NAD-dependent aldehyde dehydrogenase
LRPQVDGFLDAIHHLRTNNAEILVGGSKYDGLQGGNFVQPTIATPKLEDDIWQREIFAPVLNVAPFDDLEEAIMLNNSVFFPKRLF